MGSKGQNADFLILLTYGAMAARLTVNEKVRGSSPCRSASDGVSYNGSTHPFGGYGSCSIQLTPAKF